jgi:hypothetical protein
MVTPNNYTVAIMVPATVPSAIMTVEIDAGAAIVIPVIVPVGADAETKTLSARYCWQRGLVRVGSLAVRSVPRAIPLFSGQGNGPFQRPLRNLIYGAFRVPDQGTPDAAASALRIDADALAAYAGTDRFASSSARDRQEYPNSAASASMSR